jgi:hypothetical protein
MAPWTVVRGVAFATTVISAAQRSAAVLGEASELVHVSDMALRSPAWTAWDDERAEARERAAAAGPDARGLDMEHARE